MGRADSTVPCLASSIPLRIPAKSSWSSCALPRQFRHSRTDSTVCAFLLCTASRIPAKDFLVFVCIVSEDLGRCVALKGGVWRTRAYQGESQRTTAHQDASKLYVQKLREMLKCCSSGDSTVFKGHNRHNRHKSHNRHESL